MTFLGLEQPVAYGRQLVFDPTTAQMVLNANRDYINAVYNDYLQSQLEMKEFNKEYGDFFSPIQKDMEWYLNNVTGRIRNFIKDLYARGIDPLRSFEGRAAVSRELATMDTKGISLVRLSAENAKEYLKNKALLDREGRYDADLNERFLGYNLDGYSTLDADGERGRGIWNIQSPLRSQSLKELTEKSFNNRTAHELTKEDVLSFGPEWAAKYDPRAKYVGFTKKDLKDIADKVAPGLYGTPYAEYYRDLAKRKLIAAGYEPTEKNINAQLAQDIADTQDEYLIRPSGTLSEWMQMENLKLSKANHELAKRQYNDLKIGFTDRVKDAVRERLKSVPVGRNGSNKKQITNVVIPGRTKDDAVREYNASTVYMPGADLLELERMFYGWRDRSDEKIDIVNGQNRKRITFTESGSFYPTLLRAYDYKGLNTKGVTSAFSNYLRRNKVYGYPLQEDFTVTYNANSNNNIYDVNQHVEINANQLEGFFRLRYTKATGRHMYDGDPLYEKFRNSIMRQLGITERPSVYSKTPFNDADNGGLKWLAGSENYLVVPITKSMEIMGLGQALIDTDADREIASKDKLVTHEGIYQERDIKRRNRR